MNESSLHHIENGTVIPEYTCNDKKSINYRIGQLKSKKKYSRIFQIIKHDANQYTRNSNGIFFNLNSLNNETLYKIDRYLKKVERRRKTLVDSESQQTTSMEYTPYSVDEFSEYKQHGSKLSNKEKNILRRKRFNQFMDNDQSVVYCKYDSQTQTLTDSEVKTSEQEKIDTDN